MVFPRPSASCRISKTDLTFINYLRQLQGVELETFVLVAHRRLRWSHSVFRALKGHSGWPQNLEQQVEKDLPSASFVSYAPMPNATFESATTSLAIELIRRPIHKRPNVLYGSEFDAGGLAAVQVAKTISCASVAICDLKPAHAESIEPKSFNRRGRTALHNADQVVSTSHIISAQLAKGGRTAEVFPPTENDSNEQKYWLKTQAKLEAIHRNVLS